jgi:AAA15 family ATPase/GTPase
MYNSVRFKNFKSLKDFTIQLRAVNVLVGPNNAGKSTVLDAFRVMATAHALASRRLPQGVEIGNKTILGYELPASQIPISLMNIHSDYQSDRETAVIFSLKNGNKLRLEFHDNSRCVLTTESQNRISSTTQFKKQFPTEIYSFPTLGPLEEEEAMTFGFFDVLRLTWDSLILRTTSTSLSFQSEDLVSDKESSMPLGRLKGF